MIRVLASLLILAVASASMAFATYAYFSDDEKVSGTSIVSGTLDLGVGDTSAFQTSLDRTAFAPGDVASGSLTLTRSGSVPAVLDWKATVNQTDRFGGSTNIASFIVITQLTYGGDDYLSTADGGFAISDSNGNGWIDLQDVAAHGPFTGAPAPGTTGSAFQIAVLFHTSAGNVLQGDGASLDLVFHMRQAAGTPMSS